MEGVRRCAGHLGSCRRAEWLPGRGPVPAAELWQAADSRIPNPPQTSPCRREARCGSTGRKVSSGKASDARSASPRATSCVDAGSPTGLASWSTSSRAPMTRSARCSSGTSGTTPRARSRSAASSPGRAGSSASGATTADDRPQHRRRRGPGRGVRCLRHRQGHGGRAESKPDPRRSSRSSPIRPRPSSPAISRPARCRRRARRRRSRGAAAAAAADPHHRGPSRPSTPAPSRPSTPAPSCTPTRARTPSPVVAAAAVVAVAAAEEAAAAEAAAPTGSRPPRPPHSYPLPTDLDSGRLGT